MPRVIGIRWGRKSTATMPGLASAASPARGLDRGQLLLDLRDVAMPAEPVRLDALVDLAEMELRLGLAAGSGHPALGVDHEVADQAGPCERSERQDGGRRIAAGGAHDRDRGVDELRERRAMELREAVDRLLEQVGTRVLEAVPARVVGRVAEAEVGTLVDDRRARRDQVRDDRGRGAVRQRQEDRIRRRELGVNGQAGRAEMGVDPGDRVVVAAAAGQSDELDVGVAGEQADELGADVAGGADDPDPDPAWPAGRVDPAQRPRQDRRARRGRSGAWRRQRRSAGWRS